MRGGQTRQQPHDGAGIMVGTHQQSMCTVYNSSGTSSEPQQAGHSLQKQGFERTYLQTGTCTVVQLLPQAWPFLVTLQASTVWRVTFAPITSSVLTVRVQKRAIGSLSVFIACMKSLTYARARARTHARMHARTHAHMHASNHPWHVSIHAYIRSYIFMYIGTHLRTHTPCVFV